MANSFTKPLVLRFLRGWPTASSSHDRKRCLQKWAYHDRRWKRTNRPHRWWRRGGKAPCLVRSWLLYIGKMWEEALKGKGKGNTSTRAIKCKAGNVRHPAQPVLHLFTLSWVKLPRSKLHHYILSLVLEGWPPTQERWPGAPSKP